LRSKDHEGKRGREASAVPGALLAPPEKPAQALTTLRAPPTRRSRAWMTRRAKSTILSARVENLEGVDVYDVESRLSEVESRVDEACDQLAFDLNTLGC
jgi:hypothetical protein